MVLWHLILLLISAITIGVHSQLDSNGFLSIDCGLFANSSYVDTATNLIYVSDDQFIDTGVKSQISSSYISDTLPREHMTVRAFPNETRNCYTLRSLTVGSKYLLRATFFYGNYDNLNYPPIFDIYLGVNFWDTVKDKIFYPEIIFTAVANYLQVCLVHKNLGNPFISSLHLRRLNSKIYPYWNATQPLVLMERTNFGGGKIYSFVRYPEDLNDRWWWGKTLEGAIEISTNSSINPDPDFETPSPISQTAAIMSSIKEPLVIQWSSANESTIFYTILHFAEIQDTSSTGPREFSIYRNRDWLFYYIPRWLFSSWAVITNTGFTRHNISLVATSNSTLPPLLNGIERYRLALVGVPTNGADVGAINSIKEIYQIKKGWSGDPCVPKEFIWAGVSCTSNSSNIPRMTSLNLSSSGLSGPLSYYFGNLEALELLDLSSNDLSGSLPSSLDKLTALTYLDIRGNNKISTTLPLGLQKKQQNLSLTYRFDDINPTPSPSQKVIIISIAVIVPSLLVFVVVIATLFWLKRKHNQSVVPKQNESFESRPVANDHARSYANIPEEGKPYGNYDSSVSAISPIPIEAAQAIPYIVNHHISFSNLKKITNDFKNCIGIGGFGNVYFGQLENGFKVAVKMRSHWSSQGVKEFLAEAKNLARVHHKNLVTLMGYCNDGNCMALVYEYMQEGNLQQKLKDDAWPITWKQRLTIAYQSALGLEYLHKSCNPPLIHRDVKTSNILLSEKLEAKIADFGLSRAFDNDGSSHISTRIVGTPGYVDPEYYSTNQLSAKSDVYSFGVVLLEIITGQPLIVEGRGDLTQWVHQNLSGGYIQGIVDPKMQNKYDINSVWKVTNIACRCTKQTSSRRPSMSVVVSELKESLDLETSTENIHTESSIDSLVTDVSQDIAFEMAYRSRMPVPSPSVR